MPDNIQLKLLLSPEMNVAKMNVFLKAMKTAMGPMGKDIKLIDADRLNIEMKKVEASTRRAADAARKLKNEGTGVDDTFKRATNTATMLGKAFAFNQIAMSLQMINGAIGQFVTEYSALDKQLQNIGTLGRDNFREFEGLLTDLSTTVPDSASQLAGAVYQAISASMEGTNEELTKFIELNSKAAVAGLTDTESMVDASTSVINAYKLSIGDTSEILDTFFGGVKLGKTTIPELNSALAAFVPMAAALEVSFDQGTAAIARLTSMGTPTTQAATQMNAVFTLLQKGNTNLNKALIASGTSLKELQNKLKLPVEQGGGLVNVMRDIAVAADKGGKKVAFLTGRVEAAKIIESLAGTQEKYNDSLATYNKLQDEIEGGAAGAAYEVAAEGIEAKTDVMMNKIQAMFGVLFATIGTGATTAIAGLNKLGPALMGFSAMAPMLGGVAGGVKNVGVSILTKFAPSMGTAATATKGATVAWRAMGTAMLANPFVLAIAGIAALATGLHFLSDAMHETAEERGEEIEAEQKSIAIKQQLNKERQRQIEGSLDLVDEYEELTKKTELSKEESERLSEITIELNKTFPELSGNLSELGKRANMSRDELAGLKKELIEMDKEAKKAMFQKFANDVDIAKESIEDLFGADWGNKLEQLITSSSAGRRWGENFIRPYTKMVYNAIDDEGLRTAKEKFSVALFDKKITIDAERKNEMFAAFAEMAAARAKYLAIRLPSEDGGGGGEDGGAGGEDPDVLTFKEIAEATKRTIAQVEEYNKKTGLLNVALRDYILNLKEEKKKGETAYQLANKAMGLEKSRIKIALEGKNIVAEQHMIEQKLAETEMDKYAQHQRKVESLEAEKQAMIDIYKIKIDDDGAVAGFGITMKKDDKEKIKNDFAQLINQINEEANKGAGIKLKIGLNDEKFNEEYREFQKKDLEHKIKLGLSDSSELIAFLQKDLVGVQSELNEKQETMRQLEVEGLVNTSKYKNLREEVLELLNAELDLTEEIDDEKEDAAKKEREKQEELAKEKQDALKNEYEMRSRLSEMAIHAVEKTAEKHESESYREEIDKIEQLREDEIISEEEARRRKEKLEEDHLKKIEIIKSTARGAAMESERVHQLQLLEARRSNLEKQLAEERNKENPDEAKIKAIGETLNIVQGEIKEKGNLLKHYTDELQGTLTETFSNLFTGDVDDMKEPFRKGMGVMAGALKAQASATVTKLVLDQLAMGGGGLMSIIATPIITGIVQAAISKMLDPILSKLLSFSGGGKVTNPTAALIGDNPYSAEWVLRDWDIRAIMSEVVADYNDVLADIANQIVSLQGKELNSIVSRSDDQQTTMDDILNRSISNDLSIRRKIEDDQIMLRIAERWMGGDFPSKITNDIGKVSQSILSLHEHFADDKFTLNNIKKFLAQYDEHKKTEMQYINGEINKQQYIAAKTNDFSAITGKAAKLKMPDITIDTSVFSSDTIVEAIQTGSQSNHRLEKKLDILIKAVNDSHDIFISGEKITDEVTREMNRRRR